jgi:hypothetical protein
MEMAPVMAGPPAGDGEAVAAGEVGEDGGLAEAGIGEEGVDGDALCVADFEEEAAAGAEGFEGRGSKSADDVEAVGAAVEGGAGFMGADATVEAVDRGGFDIGWVGYDDVEGSGLNAPEEVGEGEADPAGRSE